MRWVFFHTKNTKPAVEATPHAPLGTPGNHENSTRGWPGYSLSGREAQEAAERRRALLAFVKRARGDFQTPGQPRNGFLCLIKLPDRYSSNAMRSSSCVFMTMGPYQATGSPIGLPDTSRNLKRLSLAVIETCSPSP